MTSRRGILTLVLAVCAAILSACAGFPTSGNINYGLSVDETAGESQSVAFLPDRPQPGASPEQIVEGFINAGTGPAGDWARAREFLAPSLQESWEPNAGVTVDVLASRTYTPSETDERIVDVSLDAVALVDDRGAYERAELTEWTQHFELARQSDGEWRITVAPNGVVLDRDRFPTVFHRYAVMYFDPTWEYLVPDVRWFPSPAVSAITKALVNQPPSDWLAGSVQTAFPVDVEAPSVSVTAGVAEVQLAVDPIDLDTVTKDRMLTQLQQSLAGAGVTEVRMSVGSTPITAEPVATRSTRVPIAPLVLTEDQFGFLTGGEIEELPGLSSQIVEAAPTSVQVGPDRDAASIRLATGEVARIAAGETTVLDTRDDLVDPTIDPFGYVWSVPRGEPAAIRAFAPDGSPPIEVADAWSGATAISAMALSRDGTRITAAVTAGGRTALWVAGVVRDPNGIAPVRLGDPVALAIVGGPALAVTWIDDTSVGVVGDGDEVSIVIEQIVGGPAITTAASPEAVSIAGGNGTSTLRLHSADGTLYVKRGTTWQPTATGVRVLATQQGAPQ